MKSITKPKLRNLSSYCYFYWLFQTPINKACLFFIVVILVSGCVGKPLKVEPLKFNQTTTKQSKRDDVIGIYANRTFPPKAFETYIHPNFITLRSNKNIDIYQALLKGAVEGFIFCFKATRGLSLVVPELLVGCPVGGGFLGGISMIKINIPAKNTAAQYLLDSGNYPLDFQDLLQKRVFRISKEQTRLPLIALKDNLSGSIQHETHNPSLLNANITKLLKVEITELSHKGGLHGTPIAMVIKARAELIRTVDGTSIFKREYRFESPRREISAWLADEEQRVADTVSSAIKVLAEHIVHDTLLVNSKSQPWAHIHNLSVQESTRSEPTKLAANSVSCRDCSRMLVDTNSNRPTFNWQLSFKPAIHSGQQVLQRAKPDKTVFDIAIFRRSAEKPVVGAVTPVYSRYGLSKPAHRIETALIDCSHYFWSVRARYPSRGHYRSTDWVIDWATGPQTKPPIKTQSSKRVSIYPSLYFHRFETPCLEDIPGVKPTFKIPEITLVERIDAFLLKRAKQGRKNWPSDTRKFYSIAKK